MLRALTTVVWYDQLYSLAFSQRRTSDVKGMNGDLCHKKRRVFLVTKRGEPTQRMAGEPYTSFEFHGKNRDGWGRRSCQFCEVEQAAGEVLCHVLTCLKSLQVVSNTGPFPSAPAQTVRTPSVAKPMFPKHRMESRVEVPIRPLHRVHCPTSDRTGEYALPSVRSASGPYFTCSRVYN